jgi:hypothetical protein
MRSVNAGGKRPGAGRKPKYTNSPVETRAINLPPEAWNILDGKRGRLSESEWLYSQIINADYLYQPYYTERPTWGLITPAMRSLHDHRLHVFGQSGIYNEHRMSVWHYAEDGVKNEEMGALLLSHHRTTAKLWLRPELVPLIRHGGEGHSLLEMRLDYPQEVSSKP